MEMSRHATIRIRQRAIPQDVVRLITEYGTPVRRKGNVLEYTLRKKQIFGAISELRYVISALQKAINKAVLANEDTGEIVTVYPITSRRRR